MEGQSRQKRCLDTPLLKVSIYIFKVGGNTDEGKLFLSPLPSHCRTLLTAGYKHHGNDSKVGVTLNNRAMAFSSSIECRVHKIAWCSLTHFELGGTRRHQDADITPANLNRISFRQYRHEVFQEAASVCLSALWGLFWILSSVPVSPVSFLAVLSLLW